MTRLVAFAILVAGLCGCGSRRSESDLERGRQAVVAALDSWKANEPAGKLKTQPDPVDFTEELRATFALVDYTLGPIDAADSEVIRYRVTLKLKDKKNKVSDREVVYAVLLKSPVVVARDPYY